MLSVLACLTRRCGGLSRQASQCLSGNVGSVVQCDWNPLNNGAGVRRVCGEGQGLQSHACHKCNASQMALVLHSVIVVVRFSKQLY